MTSVFELPPAPRSDPCVRNTCRSQRRNEVPRDATEGGMCTFVTSHMATKRDRRFRSGEGGGRSAKGTLFQKTARARPLFPPSLYLASRTVRRIFVRERVRKECNIAVVSCDRHSHMSLLTFSVKSRCRKQLKLVKCGLHMIQKGS